MGTAAAVQFLLVIPGRGVAAARQTLFEHITAPIIAFATICGGSVVFVTTHQRTRRVSKSANDLRSMVKGVHFSSWNIILRATALIIPGYDYYIVIQSLVVEVPTEDTPVERCTLCFRIEFHFTLTSISQTRWARRPSPKPTHCQSLPSSQRRKIVSPSLRAYHIHTEFPCCTVTDTDIISRSRGACDTIMRFIAISPEGPCTARTTATIQPLFRSIAARQVLMEHKALVVIASFWVSR